MFTWVYGGESYDEYQHGAPRLTPTWQKRCHVSNGDKMMAESHLRPRLKRNWCQWGKWRGRKKATSAGIHWEGFAQIKVIGTSIAPTYDFRKCLTYAMCQNMAPQSSLGALSSSILLFGSETKPEKKNSFDFFFGTMCTFEYDRLKPKVKVFIALFRRKKHSNCTICGGKLPLLMWLWLMKISTTVATTQH